MPAGNMSISVNGQSQVPPGFRFHPTEEELLQYYLKKKVSNEMIDLDVIRDVDLNKLEPWDIQEMYRIGTTPQNDWYFFSHKDKKYPTGTRTNRATAAGFWKATGRDKLIYSNCKRIGMRKTLVFYTGRAPHGQKSDWIMHEYRLDDDTNDTNNVLITRSGDVSTEEGWVVCRIFKKKSHHKTLNSPILSSSSITFTEARNQLHVFDSCNSDGALEQLLEYMGSSSRTFKEEIINDHQSISNNFNLLQPIINTSDFHEERFLKLPSLESPINSTSYQQNNNNNNNNNNNIDGEEILVTSADQNNPQVSCTEPNSVSNNQLITNWATLDRLVASQLNCQTDPTSRQLGCFSDPTINMDDHDDVVVDDDDHDKAQVHHIHQNVVTSSTSNSMTIYNKSYATTQDYNNEVDLWSFARSTSSSMSMSSSIDPICHLSNSPI